MQQSGFLLQVKAFPLSFAIIILGFIGFGLVEFRVFYSPFLYLPTGHAFSSGQVWRLLTPVFLHFSFMHILFNALWTWELGRRLEVYLGRIRYLILFCVLGIFSNGAQFYASHHNNFGGLSGVVYGFLGMLLVARFVRPHPVLRIADGIYIAMLVFMAIGYLGLLDMFIPGKVANAAHMGGFVGGLFLGLVFFAKELGQKFKKR